MKQHPLPLLGSYPSLSSPSGEGNRVCSAGLSAAFNAPVHLLKQKRNPVLKFEEKKKSLTSSPGRITAKREANDAAILSPFKLSSAA